MLLKRLPGREAWELREPHWEWSEDPKWAFVLERDGEQIACARTFLRSISCEGIKLAATGVGGVFTVPEHRGNGFATILLNAIEDALKDQVMILHSSPRTLYRNAGYIEINAGLWAKTNIRGVELSWNTCWHVTPEGHF